MKKTLLSILFLFITINSYADVNISGSIKYTSPTKTITESTTAPSNPKANDLWKDPETVIVKKYDGSKWVDIKETSSKIKLKHDIETEINKISDEHVKKAFQLLLELNNE